MITLDVEVEVALVAEEEEWTRHSKVWVIWTLA
jgi:hypothetical protein